MRIKAQITELLYGALFVVLVPAGLVWWAGATENVVALPRLQSPVGLVAAAAGFALMIAGARELIVRGHGLPMNPFPPRELVRSGVFGWVRNPIYIGFGFVCAGIALAAGSRSGLWLVTPAACLGSLALVYGYERPDLARRFGSKYLGSPRLSFPPATSDGPAASNRAAVFAWVLIPWLLTWFAVQAMGRPVDAFSTELPFERRWPVWQWTELLYVSAYLFIPLTAIALRTGRALRRFAESGAVATVLVTICWLTIPVVAANRPFVPDTALGRLLADEQHHSVGVAAFPAFHVLWAMLAAVAWVEDGRERHSRWTGIIAWVWAGLIALSALTTGMHTLLDEAAAVLVFFIVQRPLATWLRIRAATERCANSWREWRIGPLRVINHALYAGMAGFVGFIVAASTGGVRLHAVAVVSLSALAGAGAWAQIVERSSGLLRPFGWYGGVFGALAGAVLARQSGASTAALLSGFAVAAPWIQSIGRLRCLVQGCCHGGPASPVIGICYHHRRSRVSQIDDLSGRRIHPTPLYSIAANLLIGVLLLRLRILHTPANLLIGVYLILSGFGRFVEEGYRSEPQTPIIGGLHLYQWLAIASTLAGIVVTTIPFGGASTTIGPIDWPTIALAAAIGAIAAFAMGVDFPGSDRRFSRLASADDLALASRATAGAPAGSGPSAGCASGSGPGGRPSWPA